MPIECPPSTVRYQPVPDRSPSGNLEANGVRDTELLSIEQASSEDRAERSAVPNVTLHSRFGAYLPSAGDVVQTVRAVYRRLPSPQTALVAVLLAGAGMQAREAAAIARLSAHVRSLESPLEHLPNPETDRAAFCAELRRNDADQRSAYQATRGQYLQWGGVSSDEGRYLAGDLAKHYNDMIHEVKLSKLYDCELKAEELLRPDFAKQEQSYLARREKAFGRPLSEDEQRAARASFAFRHAHDIAAEACELDGITYGLQHGDADFAPWQGARESAAKQQATSQHLIEQLGLALKDDACTRYTKLYDDSWSDFRQAEG